MRMDDVIDGEFLTPIKREPGESITMSFGDAMRAVLAGKKVRRLDWPDEDYGVLKDENLGIFTNGKYFTYWNICKGDLDAEDWIVIKESNESN